VFDVWVRQPDKFRETTSVCAGNASHSTSSNPEFLSCPKNSPGRDGAKPSLNAFVKLPRFLHPLRIGLHVSHARSNEKKKNTVRFPKNSPPAKAILAVEL
jgi:hypothetical protein